MPKRKKQPAEEPCLPEDAGPLAHSILIGACKHGIGYFTLMDVDGNPLATMRYERAEIIAVGRTMVELIDQMHRPQPPLH